MHSLIKYTLRNDLTPNNEQKTHNFLLEIFIRNAVVEIEQLSTLFILAFISSSKKKIMKSSLTEDVNTFSFSV